jgi:26S proteasome regulatory subunit T6
MAVAPDPLPLITTRCLELEATLSERKRNLTRLEAERNELNKQIRLLRDEVTELLDAPAEVGEFLRRIGRNRALVSHGHDGKHLVEIADDVDLTGVRSGTRVALKKGDLKLFRILPTKVDPLVQIMMVDNAPTTTYDMIGGCQKQIKEIKNVVEMPITHPELFEGVGISQPKGALLYGPPGTGKTLLARAVAHHTGAKFIRISGSELVQKYIGEGARLVREVFVLARMYAPTIIFMDEVDSIGSKRSGRQGDSEVQRTMLELLNQLDGFEANNQIKIIMATNRIDCLDPALLRPGRIDMKIEFPNPGDAGRLQILRIHSRRMNMQRGIDLRKIAKDANGASGAELKGICTEAGMFALRERRVHVTQEDFEMAVFKIMRQEDKRSMSIKQLMK